MKARPILCFVLILIISLSSESCHNGKTKGITGKWIRQDYDSLNKILESNKTHWGDLILLADSTFTITGDSQEDTSIVSVPGWHVGGEIKGNITSGKITYISRQRNGKKPSFL